MFFNCCNVLRDNQTNYLKYNIYFEGYIVGCNIKIIGIVAAVFVCLSLVMVDMGEVGPNNITLYSYGLTIFMDKNHSCYFFDIPLKRENKTFQ